MTQNNPPRRFPSDSKDNHRAPQKTFSPRRERDPQDGNDRERVRRFSNPPADKRSYSSNRERPFRDRPFRSEPKQEGENTDHPHRRFGDRPYRSEPRKEGDNAERPQRRYGDRPYRSEPRKEGDNTERHQRRYGDRPYRSEPRKEGDNTERPQRRFGNHPYRSGQNRNDDHPERRGDFGQRRPRYSHFPEKDDSKQFKLRPRKKRDNSDGSTSDFEQPQDQPQTRKRTTPEFTKEEMRLNKYLSNSGLCSRREADEYIAAGYVTVNGEVVTKMGVRVKSTDDIRYHGERLLGEEKVYILMNKPKDFVTTTEDPHADQTVLDLIAGKCEQRVYPVGRLDKSTTGVLLITNDGDLTAQLTHPSYNRKKIYQVDLDKNLKRTDMEALVKGIELEDGLAQVDEISYVEENEKKIGVEIHSGRNRIIRRMFEHLGYEVKKLDRVYFAGLTKKRLRRGAWRFLTPKEIAMLKMGSYE